MVWLVNFVSINSNTTQALAARFDFTSKVILALVILTSMFLVEISFLFQVNNYITPTECYGSVQWLSATYWYDIGFAPT